MKKLFIMLLLFSSSSQLFAGTALKVYVKLKGFDKNNFIVEANNKNYTLPKSKFPTYYSQEQDKLVGKYIYLFIKDNSDSVLLSRTR